MIQLKIKTLEVVEGSPLVRITLQEVEGERELHIWVGWPEATAIQSFLEGNKPPRPMTHDLIANLLSTLQVRVLQLLISEMKDDTFYAVLTISDNGKIHEIDCRPSDGIAIVVRSAAPIYVDPELLDRMEQLNDAQEAPLPHTGGIIVERDDTTIH